MFEVVRLNDVEPLRMVVDYIIVAGVVVVMKVVAGAE
jgi:hypothetical protein